MTNAHTTSDLINAAKKYQQFHQKNSLSEIIANWTLLKSVYESPANEQEIYRLSKEKIHHLNQTDLASINTSYNQLTYQLNKLYMGSLNKTFEDILLVQDLPKGKHNL
ncbi:hypothetical protein K9M74_01890 [Candidatus Woesearchaeota archaeon]|nr:hypothetical protein [Candidatus Woesearchaeota archaeon]